MRVEESSVYTVMKTGIIFVLTIASTINTFAEPTLRCTGTVRYLSGEPAAGVRVENFDFDIPLSDAAKFIIGTRPVRTNEWKGVVLPGY